MNLNMEAQDDDMAARTITTALEAHRAVVTLTQTHTNVARKIEELGEVGDKARARQNYRLLLVIGDDIANINRAWPEYGPASWDHFNAICALEEIARAATQA